MKCLLITNKERGKKEGESDVSFWQDLVDEEPKAFTKEEQKRWAIPNPDEPEPKI